MKKHITVPGSYERPKIVIETIENEGFLCASGSHEPLIEDDEWSELLED